MEHHHYLAGVDAVYQRNRREIETFTARAPQALRTTVTRIPVVVHLLFHEDGENLSDEQVRSQIAVLNEDFRKQNADISIAPPPFAPLAGDSLIEFALAVRDPDGSPTSGITRTCTPLTEFAGPTSELDRTIKSPASGGAAAWPADKYLNVWVCTLGGGLLGYAQFPGGPAPTDGVVVLNTAFGNVGSVRAPFDKGRTATHEVGHWLNLLHIWGDDGGGCDGSDNVADTPNQAGENYGLPVFPSISCDNGPDGDMFVDYMDYTDDAGMCMFTAGQATRMQAALSGPRASLLVSDGLVPIASAPLSLGPPDLAAVRTAAGGEGGAAPRKVFDGVGWV